jgi:hypothetical protein
MAGLASSTRTTVSDRDNYVDLTLIKLTDALNRVSYDLPGHFESLSVRPMWLNFNFHDKHTGDAWYLPYH